MEERGEERKEREELGGIRGGRGSGRKGGRGKGERETDRQAGRQAGRKGSKMYGREAQLNEGQEQESEGRVGKRGKEGYCEGKQEGLVALKGTGGCCFW
ncbi:hypothetical protein Pcinc_028312 [Petrolisthes cinctipes]|uniref:Uncharacterized protein n=1 Tax=Petrolisthes cinctipes TaxID=88211 RepID=A0AAE1F355_PETCI|nr:hypothetical protein Pcinc_028312 [Petrolisthes cinctipes]